MKKILFFWLFLVTSSITFAQQTVGWQYSNSNAMDGYVLFAPSAYGTTYLIDNCGKTVNQWTSSYNPGQAAYLSETGHLIRTGNIGGVYFIGGGKGGVIEEYDWDGSLLWSFQHSSSQYCMHHDIELMPNGNILAIVWEKRPISLVEGMGRNPATLANVFWTEKIIEIEPTYPSGGNIVWEWHAIDHIIQDFDSTRPNYGVVEDHPELYDLNYYGTNPNYIDWLHFNAVDYNDSLDQILISSRFFGEIYIIDHSTTTAEAASHTGGVFGKGGDLLYRWGNPEAYQRGTAAGKKFFDQHSARWIPYGYPNEGKVMVFNNGSGRPGGNYSSADRIVLPGNGNGIYPIDTVLPFLPNSIEWSYLDTTNNFLYANVVSGVQPLPNGNVLITEGPAGRIFEVDSLHNTHFEYISPVTVTGPVSQGTAIVGNVMFRSDRYLPDFPGFAGLTMVPGEPVELNPLPYNCDSLTTTEKSTEDNFVIWYQYTSESIVIQTPCLFEHCNIEIRDIAGKAILNKSAKSANGMAKIYTGQLSPGIYTYRIIADEASFQGKISIGF